MKVSIIIPVYYNQDNLEPLYDDLQRVVFNIISLDYEVIMVDDGSDDHSFDVIQGIVKKDSHYKAYRLSRNFGSHAAILCGLEHCTGDCAIIKAADLQEPSSMILDMISKWQEGYNVVLAVRRGREESRQQIAFARLYYGIVRKLALPNMPRNGFDVYLLDRKVINVISKLDEPNSALTGQVLWVGFKTGYVEYTRLAREVGSSKWTLTKKIRLVKNTLFGFSTVPIQIVSWIGGLSFVMALVWSAIEIVLRLTGHINVGGWTLMFIFQLFSFGVIMMTLGILGEYLWRTFDVSRKRPPYVIEDELIDSIELRQ